VRTISEIIKAPQRAQNITMTFPAIVCGEISPQPTVASVINIKYIELKNNPSTSIADSVISYCEYLISNILKTYAAIKTVMTNRMRTVFSG